MQAEHILAFAIGQLRNIATVQRSGPATVVVYKVPEGTLFREFHGLVYVRSELNGVRLIEREATLPLNALAMHLAKECAARYIKGDREILLKGNDRLERLYAGTAYRHSVLHLDGCKSCTLVETFA